MTSVNLLSSTTDGQQVFLTTSQPILTSNADGSSAFVLAAAESPNKTIVLHDGSTTGEVPNSTGDVYTLIEDPSGTGGGYLQISSSAGHQGNILLSQEDLYDVLNGVGLQSESISFQHQTAEIPPAALEKKILSKRLTTKIEKPIGKGPFSCEFCLAIEPFETWVKYKKHMKSHEEDKKHKCPKCSVSFNFEKNLRLHTASHNTDDLVSYQLI